MERCVINHSEEVVEPGFKAQGLPGPKRVFLLSILYSPLMQSINE